ncbi:ankyrin repeat-containing domain protein [Aspergillus bertholletiae]|uniref:Ankyrin repeat-containing domain protein n=1 Tax=Aspergillus bertholletiae TaxID=1226010 RepID=A0A5N7APQ7_9EURO|nr:ankyrin repeat-containing domain protein [Aspergillus bertholletiae]
MYFTGLLNDTLFLIASYLPYQQDIYALVRTNRRLYHTLHDYLYEYNSRYCYGSTLAFVAKHRNIGLIEKLLKGLETAQSRLRTPPGLRWRSEVPAKEQWEEGSEEIGWDLDEEDIYPFTRDISAYPLKIAGYSVADIVQIQKSLLAAIEINNQEIITLLFKLGAQANFYRGNLRDDNPGRIQRQHRRAKDPPPLFLAAGCGHADLVKYLLNKGANPDRYRPSPLYRAVEDGRYNIIAMLLNHGAPLSYADVLKLAVQRRDRTILEFLFDNGVEVVTYGHQALHVAIRRHNQEMVKFLQLKGANLEQHLEGSEESQD